MQTFFNSDFVKKIKLLELRTQREFGSYFQGYHRSIFKGKGLDFQSVREYTIDDDISNIDWNVTAKTSKLFIKQFEEEKELTVFILADVSASMRFGSEDKTKKEMLLEIIAILGYLVKQNQDQLGLVMFSDKIENYLPPRRGQKYLLKILKTISIFNIKNQKTDINKALEYLLKIYHKKALVFVISDFQDADFQRAFKILSRKFDLIPIVLTHKNEFVLPNKGFVKLQDPETGKVIAINLASKNNRDKFMNLANAETEQLVNFFKNLRIKPIVLNNESDYFEVFKNYFQ